MLTVNFVADIPDPLIEDSGETMDGCVCLSVCLCVCGGGGGEKTGRQADRTTKSPAKQKQNIKPLPYTVYLQTSSWACCHLSHQFYLTIS